MVLFNYIIEKFDLVNDQQRVPAGIDPVDRRLIRAALVQRDFLRHAGGLHGLVEKAFGCCLVPRRRQQKVNSESGLHPLLTTSGRSEIHPLASFQRSTRGAALRRQKGRAPYFGTGWNPRLSNNQQVVLTLW
jgi:hypothetical protein